MAGKCARCKRPLRAADTIWSGTERRCYPCFNAEAAERMGVTFDETPVGPFEVADADGRRHRFEVRSFLCPTGREMMAEEAPRRRDGGGYRFAVLGDFEADAWQLFQKLYEKVQREVAERHIEYGDYGWQLTDRERLVGRIACDLQSETGDRQPLLVVDGKPLTWQEVGRMLMTYEGFNLCLCVEDSIEVVGGPLLEPGEPELGGEPGGGNR